MRVGDIVCAKHVTHRIPVEVQEGKPGKRNRVLANSLGFKFQSDHNLLSTVGVFIYLGTYPEVADGGDRVTAFADKQLRSLGWTPDEPQAADAVDPPVGVTTN